MTEGTNDTKPDVASRWQARLRDTDVSSEAVAEISAQLEPALRRKFLELVDEYHEKIRTMYQLPGEKKERKESAKEMLGLKLECAKLEAEIAMSQHENARLQQQCDYARLFHQYHVLEAEFTTNQHENARLHQEASANQG